MALCPSCQQTLPDLPERFCPNCGADITGGTGAPSPGPPWERRDQVGGFISGLLETIKEVIGSPGAFFRSFMPDGGLGAPLGYAMIVGYLSWLVSVGYQVLFQTLGTGFGGMGRGELERLAPMLAGGVAFFVIAILLGPVVLVVWLFLWSGILHLMLMLFGGAQRGFETTFRVVCYSQTASLFQIVPFCGGLISGVYTAVLSIIGLSEAHGIGKGKATAVVLLPIVLLCCCCFGGLFLVFGGLGAFMSRMR